MRDIDAAFVQQTFNVAQREREADVQHHREADDLGEASNYRNGKRDEIVPPLKRS